jgi:5'-methylthioadenosine phosphorylase
VEREVEVEDEGATGRISAQIGRFRSVEEVAARTVCLGPVRRVAKRDEQSAGVARHPEHAESPCAAGSLQLAVKPGDFVVCDQFVDRTSGRVQTFYDGPIVTHLSSAETYSPELRRIAVDVCREHGIEVHDGGTVVVIEGPRFSTKAESKWFSDAGWEVINMTQFPEAWLCRELGMAVVNISLITDYDAGVHEGTEAVDARSVLEVFAQNAERIQQVVLDMIARFPADLDTLGALGALEFTRGDGHVTAPEDIRLFETGM